MGAIIIIFFTNYIKFGKYCQVRKAIFLKMGYLGIEPRTYRLKAEYSTIELVARFF